MRKIKFRAWDDSISKMIEWDELLRVTIDGRSHYGLLSIFNRDSYHYLLMQFTGRLDTNGKEIYEKDIVKNVDEDCPFFNEKATVEWNDDISAFVAMFNGEGIYKPLGRHRKLEIVGNEFVK